MITDARSLLLQPVLDALPGEIAILDGDGTIQSANRSWREGGGDARMLWGAVGDNFLDACSRLIASAVREVLVGTSPEHSFVYPVLGPDGRRWYSVQVGRLEEADTRGAAVSHRDITEQHETELARCESEQALHALIAASPLAIMVLDPNHRVSAWNPAAERLFGFTADEVLGQFNPIVPPNKRDEFFALQEAMLGAEGGLIGVETRRQRKDGSLIDVTISRAPLRSQYGELRGSITIAADITERKRSEENQRFLAGASDVLASSLDFEDTLRRVAEMAVPRLADMCTVHLLDGDGAIRRLAVTHSDPAKQELARELRDHHAIPPDSSWGVAAVLRTGKATIDHWPSGTPLDHQSGAEEAARILRELGARSTMIAPLIARGETIGAIAFISGDSGREYQETDLEFAQELARRAATAIDNARLYREAREAEHLYRALIEHVPAIIYAARADDVSALTYISPQSSLVGAFDNNDLIADPNAWMTTLHPDDLERVRRVMAICTATGEPLAVEYRTIAADGETHWRIDRAQLIRDDAGRPLHWLGIAVDITESKCAENLLRARVRQQAAVARLGQRAVGIVTYNTLIQDAVDAVRETLGVEFSTFARHQAGSRSLLIEATSGWRPVHDGRWRMSVDGESLLAYTFRAAQPVISHNVAEETRFRPILDAQTIGVSSTLSVVVPGPEDPLGILAVGSTRGRLFTDDDTHFVQAIGNLLAASIERARDLEQIRFQANLLDVISQSVVATDPEGRITYWNRYAEEMFGWSKDEVLGRDVLDIAPAEVSRSFGAELIQRLGAGETWSGDFSLKRKDGSEFPCWLTVTAARGVHGEISSFVGVSVDMTRRVHEQLEREHLLRDLGERVKELTVLHRVAALLESDCGPLQPMLEELAAIVPHGFQHPEFATARVSAGTLSATSPGFVETPRMIRSTFAAGDGLRGTIEVCYIDAGPHHLDGLFLPEEHSLVETVADMLGSYLERIDARVQIHRSEARFRAAAEGGLDALFILEAVRGEDFSTVDYRVADLNGHAEVMLRRERDRVVGQPMREVFSPHVVEVFFGIFNQVAVSAEPVEREVQIPRRDGTIVWLHYQVVPLDDGLAVFARDVTGRKALEEQLIHQAFHDALTGLPNRALFLDRVEHARSRVQRRHEGVAVLFLDLDNFKLVNDSLGHTAGDQLLVAVADRLSSCIGSGDTTARFGGDEFAILLEDLADWGAVSDMADAILDTFHASFEVLGREIYITPSIGVAVATTRNMTATDLLRDADAAMYRAKRNGKARVVVFEPSLKATVTHRFELENDLRRAIERNELCVYYQPIVDLKTEACIGVEALVRWEHPVHGMMPPLEFIPIAEETGLIVPIGRHVLRESCRHATEWNVARPADQPLMVSVNISPRQFRDPKLGRHVNEALEESGLEPDLLHLEITESLMMEDEELAARTLCALKGLGIHLAVDDFGTGYSSLSSLRRFPVDTVKIDRAFVSGIENNPEAALLISGVIDLAHALQLMVVAEGIETACEAIKLREMGCDLAQGFYFARPASAADLTTHTGRCRIV